MNKIIISALVIAATAAVALGCSKRDNGAQIAGGETGQIRIAATFSDMSVEPSPLSRVTYDGDVPITGLKFLRLDAPSKPADFRGATLLVGDRKNDATEIVFATPQNYQGRTNRAYFIGFDPKAAYGEDIVWDPLDGKTDVLYTDVYDAGTIGASLVPVMRFKHALAQLEIICKAEAGKTKEVRDRWGKIEYINIPTHVWASFYLGSFNFDFGNPETLTLVQADYDTDFEAIDIPDNDNTAVTAAGMFVPLDESTLKLLVKTENQAEREIVVNLGAGNVFKAGDKHVVTFTFNAKEIAVTTAIEEWSEGAPALNYVF